MSPIETTDHRQRTTDALLEYFDLIKVISHTFDRSGHTDHKFLKIYFWRLKGNGQQVILIGLFPLPRGQKPVKLVVFFMG
jgi:hypothetical protein